MIFFFLTFTSKIMEITIMGDIKCDAMWYSLGQKRKRRKLDNVWRNKVVQSVKLIGRLSLFAIMPPCIGLSLSYDKKHLFAYSITLLVFWNFTCQVSRESCLNWNFPKWWDLFLAIQNGDKIGSSTIWTITCKQLKPMRYGHQLMMCLYVPYKWDIDACWISEWHVLTYSLIYLI